jgi:ParB/RepB/Spo0J family partition protein
MANSIISVALDKLIAHPDNPNRMSKANFARLVRNIKRTGKYEPIVVRPHSKEADCFEIINGHHRCKALAQLSYREADCVVWDVDDEQTDILLATLNRLGGSDELERKMALLKRLNNVMKANELAKLLPQTAKQIERLTNLKMPELPVKAAGGYFANPMVFFLTDEQKRIVEKALLLAEENQNEKTKVVRNAEALTAIAQYFLNNSVTDSGLKNGEEKTIK